MKKFILSLIILSACGQKPIEISENKEEVVELSCGKCNFNMQNEDCRLAIRKEGNTAWVTNHSFKEYGDPHAADGLCSVIKKAKVKGKITENGFEAQQITVAK